MTNYAWNDRFSPRAFLAILIISYVVNFLDYAAELVELALGSFPFQMALASADWSLGRLNYLRNRFPSSNYGQSPWLAFSDLHRSLSASTLSRLASRATLIFTLSRDEAKPNAVSPKQNYQKNVAEFSFLWWHLCVCLGREIEEWNSRRWRGKKRRKNGQCQLGETVQMRSPRTSS